MNILENTEKISTVVKTNRESEEKSGLLLILTFKDTEQELVYMEHEAAIRVVEKIYEILNNNTLPQVLILHNQYKSRNVTERKEDFSNVKDFKGIIIIDKNLKAVRLLDPKTIQDNDY